MNLLNAHQYSRWDIINDSSLIIVNYDYKILEILYKILPTLYYSAKSLQIKVHKVERCNN